MARAPPLVVMANVTKQRAKTAARAAKTAPVNRVWPVREASVRVHHRALAKPAEMTAVAALVVPVESVPPAKPGSASVPTSAPKKATRFA